MQNQGECVAAYGSLEHVFDAEATPSAASQFLDLFDSEREVESSFTLAGTLHPPSHRRTEHDGCCVLLPDHSPRCTRGARSVTRCHTGQSKA